MAESAAAAMREAGVERTAGRVAVAVTAVLAVPKSYRGKVRADAVLGISYPSGDVDNFAKSALDGMNGVVWDDDRQVVTMAATKRWGGEGEEEGLMIEVAYPDGSGERTRPE